MIYLAKTIKQLGVAYMNLSILFIAPHFEEVKELLHRQIQLEEMAKEKKKGLNMKILASGSFKSTQSASSVEDTTNLTCTSSGMAEA